MRIKAERLVDGEKYVITYDSDVIHDLVVAADEKHLINGDQVDWNPDLVRFCETQDEALKVRAKFIHHICTTAIDSDIDSFNNNQREKNSKHIWASDKVKPSGLRYLVPIE